jgi:uncharacterized BrkB/YihY/UPF0761 family membrane protein
MANIFTFLKDKYNLILYFLIAVVGFGSIGVWLPMFIDWFANTSDDSTTFSETTNKSTPGNIITYFLSIFLVSLIDRILYVIDKENYKHRKTEIFISLLVIVAVIYFVLKSFKYLRMNDLESANTYALLGASVSFVIWWIANYQDKKTDPYSALGGNSFN